MDIFDMLPGDPFLWIAGFYVLFIIFGALAWGAYGKNEDVRNALKDLRGENDEET